jgi:endonuclease/exonuclease/phosphatase family metal-dependent hydrolase
VDAARAQRLSVHTRVLARIGGATIFLYALAACAPREPDVNLSKPPADEAPQQTPVAAPAVVASADARDTIRVATFNTSLNDDRAGGLIARLEAGDENARKIAASLQSVRPDIVLLNEFDYDDAHAALALFRERYLGVAQFGKEPLTYAYAYSAPVNTGVPSGLDVDGNGRIEMPGDGWGYGAHPGQYGMVVLSQFPIDNANVRTFRMLRWADMPGALRPTRADGSPFYDDATWQQLRLSSKSHWDVPVTTPFGVLHVLAHHPTPPVFDGPDDHNGKRNFDEIRLWADYVSGDAKRSAYIRDDAGKAGGLAPDAHFVIAGDHNADPLDGESYPGAIDQLLRDPRIHAEAAPTSTGAEEASQRDGGANVQHAGHASRDTGAFSPTIGNLRIDYVLPSVNIEVRAAQVFWPTAQEPEAAWLDATDHRIVWLDIRW